MRLIHTQTGQFYLIPDPSCIRYAILSHVWTEGDSAYVPEQTYQDVQAAQDIARGRCEHPVLSKKIMRFCEVARLDGFEWGWVDTCCIDKTSSSEVSEAINSMFAWYRHAVTCYVFLHDVSGSASHQEQIDQFRKSKWFKRGWTLQELLAPSVLLFLANDWTCIGSKHTLAPVIEEVTGIPVLVLTFETPLDTISIAQRMSWAASRETSREEDEAYSLLGIFGVSMPTTYGEGRHAFIRLQEEILKQDSDQSIFAWGPRLRLGSSESQVLLPLKGAYNLAPSAVVSPSSMQYLLAHSPRAFLHSSSFVSLPRGEFAKMIELSAEEYTYQVSAITASGIRLRLPTVTMTSDNNHPVTLMQLALLACTDGEKGIIALPLHPRQGAHGFGTTYFIGGVAHRFPSPDTLHYIRIMSIRAPSVNLPAVMTDVLIPHWRSLLVTPASEPLPAQMELRQPGGKYEVRLSGWSRKLLQLQGCDVFPSSGEDISLHERVLSKSSESSTDAPHITLSRPKEAPIVIQIGRCHCIHHTLSILIGTLDKITLFDDGFTDEHHSLGHPVHVFSWKLQGGVLLREVVLPTSTGERSILRLTLTLESRDARCAAYRLGLEICQSLSAEDKSLLAPPPIAPPLSIAPPKRRPRSFPSYHLPAMRRWDNDVSVIPTDAPTRLTTADAVSGSTSLSLPVLEPARPTTRNDLPMRAASALLSDVRKVPPALMPISPETRTPVAESGKPHSEILDFVGFTHPMRSNSSPSGSRTMRSALTTIQPERNLDVSHCRPDAVIGPTTSSVPPPAAHGHGEPATALKNKKRWFAWPRLHLLKGNSRSRSSPSPPSAHVEPGRTKAMAAAEINTKHKSRKAPFLWRWLRRPRQEPGI